MLLLVTNSIFLLKGASVSGESDFLKGWTLSISSAFVGALLSIYSLRLA